MYLTTLSHHMYYYHSTISILPLFYVTTYTVQLKENLTNVGRAHTIYWLKTRDFINQYWCVQEGKPAKINF